MAVALIFEYGMGLQPCPMCVLQRIAVITVGLVALVAAIHNPRTKGIRVYGCAATIVALLGAGVAVRHLWLQSLPADQVPACGPGLDYLLEVFPLTDVLSMILTGDGSCAEVVWSLFGISIPGWTLVGFCGLIGLGVLQIVRPKAATA